jgi:hypothetical protein
MARLRCLNPRIYASQPGCKITKSNTNFYPVLPRQFTIKRVHLTGELFTFINSIQEELAIYPFTAPATTPFIMYFWLVR